MIVDQTKKEVEFNYSDGTHRLSFEFLRTHTPSADVKNPATGKFNFIANKRTVNVTSAEPVGNYAVRFFFSDGHNNGIFSWEYIKWLIENHDDLWNTYQNLANKNQTPS
ncbi:gamma-butyrobetaine hydroxylase-like domain-containing protein [Candidatus Ichthyocystis hellenicum]|uniref:gamma-butyrobetaine hydroxylase-like domain-containing protein n=1 Tax=Candidatus Ichthyocystis hellenicum TaxID=1561003 RepID=UPI003B9682DC